MKHFRFGIISESYIFILKDRCHFNYYTINSACQICISCYVKNHNIGLIILIRLLLCIYEITIFISHFQNLSNIKKILFRNNRHNGIILI